MTATPTNEQVALAIRARVRLLIARATEADARLLAK
jgi:hypothetical protein